MKKRQPISLGRFPWIADTVFQLATNAPPTITLQFREEILAERVKPDLKEAAENWGPRLDLLRRQREDGSWPTPKGNGDEAAFFTVARQLLALHDQGVRKDDPAVQKALSFLDKVQNEDGSFSLNIHHTAFTLWVLAMFGLGKTPVARRAVRFLEKTRRADSGWLDPQLEPGLAEERNSPSCAWTTLHCVFALAEFPEQRRSLEVRKGAVLLLDRLFKRNHKSFFGHPDHWRELDYGYEGTACFKWAVPKMLLILGHLGCGPETKEVSDLLDFLRKTLRPNGRWGATIEGNDELTLRVLRSLMAVQEAGQAAS